MISLNELLGFAMASLYRYMEAKYADSFLNDGEILFRSLSYFRDYEDDGVRGDEYEGTRVHLPQDGLKIRYTASGEEVAIPYTFESTANENDIFVLCLSNELSKTLASRFKSNTCIEITDQSRFISMLRSALARRPSIKNKTLLFGPVKYYAPHHPPIVDWALPKKIAFSKPETLQWQNEYRAAFAINNAFTVNNVSVKLVPLGTRSKQKLAIHPQHKLKIGNMKKLCKVHNF